LLGNPRPLILHYVQYAKMARPRISSDQKRSIKFTFRVTEQELNKLALLAETCGLAPGVLIREKIFKGRFPIPKTAKLDLNTYLELKKIGVNLNQLTRQVNSGVLPAELSSKLTELLKQQGVIINLLLHDC